MRKEQLLEIAKEIHACGCVCAQLQGLTQDGVPLKCQVCKTVAILERHLSSEPHDSIKK